MSTRLKEEARSLRLFTNALRHALGLGPLYDKEEIEARSPYYYLQTYSYPTQRRAGRTDTFTDEAART